ncbi:MAG: hypothetical protein ACRYGB_07065 [Janthinobacterium lividum]
MQNLYMMATQIREQEMQKMAMQITSGSLSIEQAMLHYNVATKEAVLQRLETLKSGSNRFAEKNQSEFIDMNVQAA